MADTSSASSEFECDYSSGEEAYNYNIDVPFYRGVERKILPADVPLVLRPLEIPNFLSIASYWLDLVGP